MASETEQRRQRWQAVVDRARRDVEKAEDEAFEAAVRADLQRVLEEIRQGRTAKLQEWDPTPGQWLKSHE